MWSGRTLAACASGRLLGPSATRAGRTSPLRPSRRDVRLAGWRSWAGGRDVQRAVAGSEAVQAQLQTWKVMARSPRHVAAPHWSGGDAMAAAWRMLTSEPGLPEAVLTVAERDAWLAPVPVRPALASTTEMQLSAGIGLGADLEQLGGTDLSCTPRPPRWGVEENSWLAGWRSPTCSNFSQDLSGLVPGRVSGSGTCRRRLWPRDQPRATSRSSLPGFQPLPWTDLSNLEAWTKQYMAGLPGICVLETMR